MGEAGGGGKGAERASDEVQAVSGSRREHKRRRRTDADAGRVACIKEVTDEGGQRCQSAPERAERKVMQRVLPEDETRLGGRSRVRDQANAQAEGWEGEENPLHAVLPLERPMRLKIAQDLRVNWECAFASHMRVAGRVADCRRRSASLNLVTHRLRVDDGSGRSASHRTRSMRSSNVRPSRPDRPAPFPSGKAHRSPAHPKQTSPCRGRSEAQSRHRSCRRPPAAAAEAAAPRSTHAATARSHRLPRGWRSRLPATSPTGHIASAPS